MAYYGKIKLTNEWVDINTEFGIPLGSQFKIQNISGAITLVAESELQPASEDGLSVMPASYGDLSILTCRSDFAIWCRANSDGNCTIQVYD